ncbi:hypothetical protein JNM05_00920 [bacterium]|nr:hypothetical protein [bacterium]
MKITLIWCMRKRCDTLEQKEFPKVKKTPEKGKKFEQCDHRKTESFAVETRTARIAYKR